MKIAIVVMVVLLASQGLASEPAPSAPATTEEISALRAEIAELRAVLSALQAAQPMRTVSIGVMPVDGAERIPEVGEFFREVIISTLREAGICAVESLDDETLRWVQRQDQLVRERWIDPRSAPLSGELRGITHYLLGTVTRYQEEDVEDVKVIAGILVVRFGGGARVRYGSLVVDFRLVDAETGIVQDSFRTESSVRRKELAGGGYAGIGVGRYRHLRPLPEQAARLVARQCAERIAGLLPEPVAQPLLPAPIGPPTAP